MASTRNKNTLGNYQMERTGVENHTNYWTNAVFSVPVQTFHPGDGLLAAKTARNELSSNACDIESSLFGIGSTDLVNPRPNIYPELNTLKSLSIIDKAKTVVVEPTKVNTGNRPMILR
jgi:hypothetical protein